VCVHAWVLLVVGGCPGGDGESAFEGCREVEGLDDVTLRMRVTGNMADHCKDKVTASAVAANESRSWGVAGKVENISETFDRLMDRSRVDAGWR